MNNTDCQTTGVKCMQIGGRCWFMSTMNFIARAEHILRQYIKINAADKTIQMLAHTLDFALKVTACRDRKRMKTICERLPPHLAELHRKYIRLKVEATGVSGPKYFVQEGGHTDLLLMSIFIDIDKEYTSFAEEQSAKYQELFLVADVLEPEEETALTGKKIQENDPLVDDVATMWLEPDYSLNNWLSYYNFTYSDADGIPNLPDGGKEYEDDLVDMPWGALKSLQDDVHERGITDEQLLTGPGSYYSLHDRLNTPNSLFDVIDVKFDGEDRTALQDVDVLLRKVIEQIAGESSNIIILGGTIDMVMTASEADAHAVSWNWCDAEPPNSIESIKTSPIVICDSALQMCFRTDEPGEILNWSRGKGYDDVQRESTFMGAIIGLDSSFFTGGTGYVNPDWATARISDITIVVAKDFKHPM